MALPWFRIINGLLGVTDVVRLVKGRSADDGSTSALSSPGRLEKHLAGVVVSALKETFDRDRARLDLEQQRADEERQRAERAMRLELLRQAGDREIGRQRLLAGMAVGSLLSSLAIVLLVGADTAARLMLASGALFLIGAFACAATAQSQVARALGRGDDRALTDEVTESTAGRASVWLLAVGLALAVVGALLG